MRDCDEFEKLPLQDQWMGHPIMPATSLFRLWKRKFERLIWMALYNPRGGAGTAQWYCCANIQQDEEDMLASDDDYEPEGDEDEDSEEEINEDDSEDDMPSDDGRISDEEVNKMMEDAFDKDAHQRRMDLQSQGSPADVKSIEFAPSEPADQSLPRFINLDRETEVSLLIPSSGTTRYHVEEYRESR